MRELLFHYYLRLYEALGLCAVLACASFVSFWIAWRRWRAKNRALEQAYEKSERSLADEYKGLCGAFENTIAHRWGQHMGFIANKSTETLDALEPDQEALCEKQRLIRAKANELDRQASNVMRVLGPEPTIVPVLMSVNRLLNGVVGSFFEYAADKGVTIRPALDPLEATLLDWDLTEEACGNVIHNAIKYSAQGRTVGVELTLKQNSERGNQSMVRVRVTNVPKPDEVIADEDRERIFELCKRADGLIEPGHGLGLYLARRAARLQGGDVTLIQSNFKATVFEIVLPYTKMIDPVD